MAMIPSYKIQITVDVMEALHALERAAKIIERSETYTNNENTFHAETVSDYNRITSMTIGLQELAETLVF